jgi:hypothetical protein
MGRRPIGEQAMTATERQRRWRAKVRANKPAGTVERLQARIRQLEIERAVLRTEIEKLHAEVSRFMHAWAGSWTLNKARVHELETELASARREAPVDPDSLPKSYRKKLKLARQRQESAFEDRVRKEAHKLLDELFVASSVLNDAHSSLNNMLDGREPQAPQMTGYQDLRPVLGAVRRRAR